MTEFDASFWIGIDGGLNNGSNDVFQVGADGAITADASFIPSNYFSYYAWWEWFPHDLSVISNFPVSPGNLLTCLLTANDTYQTLMFQSSTTFVNETDGTWLMADYDKDKIPDLVFIKTANTPSGMAEVHIASGKSKYQKRILETKTVLPAETDGTWLMADYDKDKVPDLVFIKTANTPTGNVEVHIASGRSKYQKFLLQRPTAFAAETDGTWLMADYDRDGIADLVFIKTANTPSGMVEVHIASGKSQYQNIIQRFTTAFAAETDGTWLMADYDRDKIPDLVFIKTANTPSGNVEVHIASGKSNYQDFLLQVPTFFVEESDGTWIMADYDNDGIPDLVFIKTANTPSGNVEVHIASGNAGTSGNVIFRNESRGISTSFEFRAPHGVSLTGDCAEWICELPSDAALPNYNMVTFENGSATDNVGSVLPASSGFVVDMVVKGETLSIGGIDDNQNVTCVYAGRGSNYQRIILALKTVFAEETDGTWCMADYDKDKIPDLVFIKTANTASGMVEVHIASGKSKYQNLILDQKTAFAEETDGTWLMADYDKDGIADLVFIKTDNTPSGMVEVHIASGKSQYQDFVLHAQTPFVEETDGTWVMADYDKDKVPDLVFIRTANTASGMVEVSILSGKSKYQNVLLHTTTAFTEEADGTWLMADFDRDKIADLIFVKTSNTPSGNVEVHVATGKSKYMQLTLELPTAFVEETDGTWLMADYDKDGVPDLVFVKTANTPSGMVEVHIAAGDAKT